MLVVFSMIAAACSGQKMGPGSTESSGTQREHAGLWFDLCEADDGQMDQRIRQAESDH